MFRKIAVTCTALVFFPAMANALVVESGEFYDEALRLKNLAFAENSGLYVPPTENQRQDFRALAQSLYDNDWPTADTQAAALGYELVKFTNTTTGSTYWGVRETLVNNAQTKGWGSFFINEDYVTTVTVEVPHPVHDTNTHRLGARVFEDADARGFMMAGSHRSANGSQTANPTSLDYSIFQEVHEVWNGGYGDSTAWQMHGYGSGTADHFPDGTDAVLSDGAGNVTVEMQLLDAALEGIGLFGDAYVFNELETDDPLNEQVNGEGVNGYSPFWRLGARNNPQGQYSRDQGGTFVHAEFSYYMRTTPTRRDQLLAEAIVGVIQATATVQQSVDVPSPAPFMPMLAGLGFLALSRKSKK